MLEAPVDRNDEITKKILITAQKNEKDICVADEKETPASDHERRPGRKKTAPKGAVFFYLCCVTKIEAITAARGDAQPSSARKGGATKWVRDDFCKNVVANDM